MNSLSRSTYHKIRKVIWDDRFEAVRFTHPTRMPVLEAGWIHIGDKLTRRMKKLQDCVFNRTKF